jgi:hypothetical protein
MLRLLRPFWLQGRNIVRKHPRGALALVVGLLALLLALQRLTEWFLEQLVGVAIGQVLAHHLMSMFLFSLQWMLAFSAVINALSAFFLSHELEVWETAPMRPGAVFWAKFAETSLTSAWMVVLLLVPVFFAYGNVLAAPPAYFVAAVVLPFPYVLTVVAGGVILALAIARILPVRRTRELMRFFGILGIATLVVIFRVLQPERLVEKGNFDKMAEYISGLHPDALEKFPSYWLTELLHGFMRGDFEYLFTEYLSLYLGVFVGALVLARLAHAGWYSEALQRFREAPPPPPRQPGRLGRALAGALHRLPPWLAQLIAKDLRVLAREPVVWTQLALMAVIVLIYFYNLYLLPIDELESLEKGLRGAIGFVNCGFMGSLLVAAALRFGFPAVSLEGEAFLVLHTSPLGMRRYFLGKLLVNTTPLLVLGLALAALAHGLLQPPWPVVVLGYLDAVVLAVSVGWQAVAFGAVFRNLRATNFSHLPSGPGGIGYLVASMSFVLVFVGLQAYPYWIFRKAWYWATPASTVDQLVCGALLLSSYLLAVACTWYAWRRGLDSLERGLE